MAAAVTASVLVPAPWRRRETAPPGIAALDRLVGGLERAVVAEITGPASSGRTTRAASWLRETTGRGECAAYIDGSNAADPAPLAAAAVALERPPWVRCGGTPWLF